MNDEAVKWLREQIEGDKAAALIISCGGFAPERWDTDPQGQVNPARMPEAADIDALLAGDEDDPVFRPHGYWVAMHSWEQENNEPEEDRVRGSDLPAVIVNDGRREADHIRRHDPRNVVARCEAELAILDAYEAALAYEEGCREDHERRQRGERAWLRNLPPGVPFNAAPGLGHAVHLLASGYKYRPGYAEHWAG